MQSILESANINLIIVCKKVINHQYKLLSKNYMVKKKLNKNIVDKTSYYFNLMLRKLSPIL